MISESTLSISNHTMKSLLKLRFTTIALPLLVTFLTQCAPYAGHHEHGAHDYLSGYNTAANHDHHQFGSPSAGGYWDGDGVQGAPKITIHLAEQKAYFYKGGQLVGLTPISTGKEGNHTPRGHYKVTERDVDHRSSLYGVIKDVSTGQILNDDADSRKDKPGPGQVFEGAPMWNFLRFNGAIGMHTGYLPGYAASHGCVRTPDYMAKKFYQNAPLGTPVIVK